MKPKLGPECIFCHKQYDPSSPGLAKLKNNPGFCSVKCGYDDSKASSAPTKGSGKPQDASEPVQGKIVPLAVDKAVLEPPKAQYVPSKLQGLAIRMPEPKSTAPVAAVDLVTGETLEAHPAELLLVDQVDEYYSHSTIKSLASCSAKVYFKKTGVPSKPSYALERGSAVHAALEAYQKRRIDPLKVFEEEWKLKVLDNESQMKESDRDKIKNGYEESRQMISEFVTENGSLIERSSPKDAEVEFSIVININVDGGVVKRRIYGKMDFVVWNRDHTAYRIMDYKTSGQVVPDAELDRDTQFAIYQLAGTELYGFPPDKMVFYYLKGKHICKDRFSKTHPRPTDAAGIERCLQFAFDIPIKTPEEIQAMIDCYYGPTIMLWEAGVVQKNLSDPSQCLYMCSYKEHCDKVMRLPAPKFVRLVGN